MEQTVNDGALKQFVQQIEGVNAEIKSLTVDRAELFKAAQQQGYDPKVMRRVISERAMAPAERAEAEELFRVYWDSVQAVRGPVLTEA
jgi:uncharacterized protein (UPF0335 family)